MKEIFPDYYPQFKCIAQQCRHSCCIGWEIEVDPVTLARYRQDPAISAHLFENCILLDEKERCPFLNPDGLCSLILSRGEDALCQICRDHPRFRNVFSDRVEIGLGLCCEEAARLILSQQNPMRLTPFIGNPPPQEQSFFAYRQQLFALLQDRTRPIDDRLSALIGAPLPPAVRWVPIYRQLERLDPVWDSLLDTVGPPVHQDPVVLEQLAAYFIYRHLAGGLEDGCFEQRLRFAVLSVQLIRSIPAPIQEVARMYSAEVEYSDQNLQELLEYL